jgi:histidine triad (HIT) family protein
MAECPFCKIAKGEIPAFIVYDSKDVMAFLDIKPANPGHVLVIPKEHYQILPQIPEELNSALLQLTKVIAHAQIEALGAQGVEVLQRNGTVAGQLVPHVYIHVIPRFKDDKVVDTWEPVEMKDDQLKEIQRRLIEKAKEIASGTEVKHSTKTTEAPPLKEEPTKKEKLLKVKPRHG